MLVQKNTKTAAFLRLILLALAVLALSACGSASALGE